MRASARLALRQVTGGSASKTFVLWDEVLLTIVNPPKNIIKELTFTEKAMEKVGWKTQIKRTQKRCFEAEIEDGILVVRTLQGFWKRILMWLVKSGRKFELVDLRVKDLIPPPTLGYMDGFRLNQRQLLVDGLAMNCSGIIQACTRYGKSLLMRNTCKAWPGLQTLILIPGKDLLKQAYEEYSEAFPDREVKRIGGGSRTKYQSEDITVCSADSIHKIDVGPVRLVLIDEPHALIAESRVDHLASFPFARKLAFGATPTGRFDGRDYLLEGLVGPVLSKRTFPEALKEGAVCNIKVMMVRWPIRAHGGDRSKAYRDILQENELVGRFCRYLSDVIIPRDWQTLFFIKTEKQAEYVREWIGSDVALAMAKLLTDKQREEMTECVRRNRIKRILCSDIYVQGVTFHDIMCLVNLSGGGNSTTTIQKPGRLAEIRHGKNAGLLVDFLFESREAAPGVKEDAGAGGGQLIRESHMRLEAYRELGYEVHIVDRCGIEEWFMAQNITAPTTSDR